MEAEKPQLTNILIDINTQVASFRDMLIHIGHDKHDCPELRAQIRKTRRACVESCLKTSKLIISQLRPDSSSEVSSPIMDNPHLILLFYLSQLFLRELVRSYHLLKIIPMDMNGFFDSSAVGPSNLGNVISQLLLCKQINPDFYSEELCSITKDSQEISKLLSEMQQYMPVQESYLEYNEALKDKNTGPWPAKRRRAAIYKNMGLLCCISRQHPSYL